MDEKCADLHKPFISYLFLVGVTVRSAESLQLKEQILKEQITDDLVFFKMPFRPCPSGCDRSLSADTIVVFSVWASNTLKMRSWMTHVPVVGV